MQDLASLGVLWTVLQPIPGVDKIILKLKQLGKSVQFVSNNSGLSMDVYRSRFKKFGFDVTADDVCLPVHAIIDHLRRVDFSKEILLSGPLNEGKELTKAGFKLANIPDKLNENLDALQEIVKDDKNIGAVIVDVDFNVNYPKVMKACACLERLDVLYICGATDVKIPFTREEYLIGPNYTQNAITDFTGRTPLLLGKPGLNFGKYVIKKFDIKDASRTLFVGDTMEQDMGFAKQCGFQNLLTLTGSATLDEMRSCNVPDWIPDYYISSLADLHELIENKLNL